MTLDIEALIDGAQLPRTTATLCLRADLVAQWEKLHAQWRTAAEEAPSLGEKSPKAVLGEQLKALGDDMTAHQVTFTFEALPAVDYSTLIAKFPPLGDDKTRFRWNEAAFRPALIAASVIDPKMTEEQCQRLLTKLSAGQTKTLYQAALIANEGEADIPFEGAVYAESPSSGGQ